MDQRVQTLYHVPAIFLDDIEFMFNYKDAGELRAINEFNEINKDRMCIDRWYGVKRRSAISRKRISRQDVCDSQL